MFTLLGIALAAGLIAGFVARGRFEHLKHVSVRWTPLLFASLVVALVPLFVDVPSGVRLTLQLGSNIGVLAFLLVNIVGARAPIRTGWVVTFVGWLLNFVVIAANGAMPLSLWALERSGQSLDVTPGEGGFFKIEIANDDTLLRPLGDVIPVPVLTQVVSIGDIVLMAGIAWIIAAGMRARSSTRAAEATA